MKKRILSLFLAFLTLSLACALSACDEEYGEFYTDENGILQNTKVECAVTSTGAREITYEIRNATPYSIWIKAVVLHIYRDGKWEEAPYDEGYIWVDRDLLGGWLGTSEEVYEREVDFGYGEALYPGDYRIVVEMEAKKNSYFEETAEFCAIACFTVTDEVYGVFETKDGILQNTKVRLATDGKELTAPVKGIGAGLQNESCFEIEQQKYAVDECYEYLLELWEDGEWKQAPSFGEVLWEGNSWEKDFWKPEQIEGGNPALMDKRYIALTPGQYRARVKYVIVGDTGGAEIPEGQLEAVGYFTVIAE